MRAARRLPPGWPAALVISLLFVTQALILLPYPGLQTDEALFGSLIYEPRNLELSVPVFKHRIPLMVLSYLGSLKSLLYAGLFALWPPSLFSVRVPMVLAGGLTVWLFFRLLRDTLGRRAAWIGALLLATDTTFLVTTTFDWGPVALQHLFLVGGLALLVRFHRTSDRRALAAACFLFGLGLWDKALFIWMLSGLAVASLVVLRRELLRAFTMRHAAIAIAALLLGASPLIIYNLRYRGPTFSGARYTSADLAGKARLLISSLDGSSLFGYLTREDDGHLRADRPNRFERVSLALSEAAGRRRTNLLVPALALALALLPLYWRTPAGRACVLALIAMLVGWAQMALNQGTGGATHHAVLLWPFPHLIVAASLAQLTQPLRRAGLLAASSATALLASGSVLVTNEHLAQLIRHGPGPVWSDAIQPLAERLKGTPASHVVVTDWGMLDSLRLLRRGRLPLHQVIDLASKDSLDEEDRRTLAWVLHLPAPIFVGYTPQNESVPGSGARIAAHAAAAGYSKQMLYTVSDRHRRPVFEVFRFRPTSAPDPPLSR